MKSPSKESNSMADFDIGPVRKKPKVTTVYDISLVYSLDRNLNKETIRCHQL